MAYHTTIYLLLFLPAVALIYQLVPQKIRWCVLLSAGYVFFWIISGKLVLFLMGTTVFTHYISVLMSWLNLRCQYETGNKDRHLEKQIALKYKKYRKGLLIFGIVVLVGVLAYLKYFNFFADNMNSLFTAGGINFRVEPKTLLLPIGISFYTLQAVGYLADVYWDKVKVHPHPGKLALFLGFFPQIMEGPISMYSQTADALWEGKPIRVENIADGSIRILWGLFKKMIIADRLNILVKTVFDQYENYNGVVVVVAAVAYTVQLYMEFSGCMDIILGSGKIFGISLPENFRQPFASRNAAEFWRRWHITLGVWFKTYIFYPITVSKLVKRWNKFSKKHFGKYIAKLGVSAMALFPVWLCNGLWHGPRWSYIFYGLYYFVLLLASVAVEPVKNTLIRIGHIDENALYWRIPQILKTWVIIFTGELFFRANGLKAGFHMFESIFHNFNLSSLWDGTLLTLGLDLGDFLAIVSGCLIAAIVGMIKERKLLPDQGLRAVATPVRWAVVYGLIFAVLLFGAYGNGYQQVDMIYAGF